MLFWKILLTEFIAEMGDKTQLMLVAMTSRFKVRDILLGTAAAVLVLNGLAVALGSLVSQWIPLWLIRLAAAAAFLWFAWSTLRRDEGEEAPAEKKGAFGALSVFLTFFAAELGDKTQLTAITFAISEGKAHALTVWLACSAGLFAADILGMAVGAALKSRLPEGFLSWLAFVIFSVFGMTTLHEGCVLLLEGGSLPWILTAGVAAIFAVLCLLTVKKHAGEA